MSERQQSAADETERLASAVRSDIRIRSDSPLVEPIPKTVSLATQAYEHIKAAIVAGDLDEERLYSVNQFADLLGVSRTPVREALLTLAGEGLLKVHKNRGFQVIPITQADLKEIVDLRRILEVQAMERLAMLSPPPLQAFAQAREIYHDLQRAADEGSLLEFLSLDRRFHLTLVEALGNRRLTDLIGELRDHTFLPGLRRLATSRQLHETGREHLSLLEVLEAGDAVAAASITHVHVGRVLKEWSLTEHGHAHSDAPE